MEFKKKKLILVLFFAFLILSAAARVIFPSSDAPINLSWSQGPSTDGAYYLTPAVDFVRGGAYKPIAGAWNAPAFSILYLPTFLVFGIGFVQANLTTVVLSLIAFAFFFLVARTFRDDRTLALSCLFWALTYMWAMFNRIPIIYTSMVMYMLIAVWLWLKGTRRPVFFVGAWAVALIAALFIKIIAASLVPAFLVGHLVIYLSRERAAKSTTARWLLILLYAGIAVVLIVLIARFFNLSPIDVAAGRIRKHIREGFFGDNFLVYLFNFGASGGVIENNPVIALLSYCYLIFFIKDLFLKRIRLSDNKSLAGVLLLTWLLFGAVATIFFKYAPPRFFLFLYPPMFILAAAALVRFLDPTPRGTPGYGFYLVLPVWLIFIVFRFLLIGLIYLADNFETFVVGLGLSVPAAKALLSLLNFASSFYFLLTASLIISIVITSLTFLLDRRWADKKDPIVRRTVRVAVAWVVIFVFLVGQGAMFWAWIAKPRHTLYEASREVGTMVGPGAKISGPYAHPLTMETNRQRLYMSFWDPALPKPCERFAKYRVTHLAIDTVNGLAYVDANYPDTYDCLVLINTFYIRGNPVDLYLYTGAEGYTPTDYERAMMLMKSENWRAAAGLLSGVIKEDPKLGAAYVSLARCLVKLGDIRGAQEVLTTAMAVDPDNMTAHWGLGQILEQNGDIAGAVEHYREASELFPASKIIRKRLAELESREK